MREPAGKGRGGVGAGRGRGCSRSVPEDAGAEPHQRAQPAAARLGSVLPQVHGPHALQLAPADGVPLVAGALGPRGPRPRGREEQGGQLTVHVGQLLRLDHIFHCWKVQREGQRLKVRVYVL